jgi:hypothetical protein
VAGGTILAADWNTMFADLATALTNCLTRDGQSPLLGNLNIANFDLLNAKATTPATGATGKEVATAALVDAKLTSLLAYSAVQFTPTVEGSVTPGVATGLTGGAVYRKLYGITFITIYVTWTAHTGTGDLLIGSLPAAPAALLAKQALTVSASNLTYTAGAQLVAFVNAGETKIRFQTIAQNAVPTAVAIDGAATVFVTGVIL